MLKLERKERVWNYWKKVLDDNNLYEAYKQVYRDKGASGIYGISVGELEQYMKVHKEEIKE